MKKINIFQLSDSNLSSTELMALQGKGVIIINEPYTCACMVGGTSIINNASVYGTAPLPPPTGGGGGEEPKPKYEY